MKKNDFIQIKGLDIKELKIKALALKKEIADLVLDKNMKKLKDLKSVGKKKKDLAQVSTVIRQKELLAELEPKIVNAEINEKQVNDDKNMKPKEKKGGKRTKKS